MPRPPNAVALMVLEHGLIYVEPKSHWNTGRLGPVSQKLATKGLRLRQRTEGDGIFLWGEETGVVRTWSDLKNKQA